MPTSTTNYGWQKPDVGASTDAWGGLLNTDLDGIDSTVKTVSNVANAALPAATASTTYVAKAGDTMTGPLNVGGAVTCTLGGGSGGFIVDAASGGRNFIGKTSGSSRWTMQLGNNVAEGSGNAGSDFTLTAADNTGAALGTPLTITRSNGFATFSGNSAGQINLNGPVASYRQLYFQSALTARWAVGVNNTAESGSNAGSDFFIGSSADAGTGLAQPLTIKRSTGVCTFSQPIVNGSDARIKEDVQPLVDALAKVQALQGVSFIRVTRPPDGRTGEQKREIGFIAQEVEPIVPEAIELYDIAPPEVGQTPTFEQTLESPLYGLAYTQLIALAVEAIKTLAARVEALEAAANG